MRIFVRPSEGWNQSSIALLHNQLEFALGRFNARVRSLTVRLTAPAGPRGTHDRQCAMAIRLDRPRRVIVVDDVDADESVVISRTVERAARAVARAVRLSIDSRPVGSRR